ncbi:bifunctional phosphoribosylaminoimidazolecarboxamide formyltransferase/IMP cyclohydrolase [candidate division KSB1 bacterium]|nr:bifunctional phosphoribosylaminoimidazolecarboxamide formyltransferase/IMP cyclohydrolase [candidate division KSB1 bacterium]
MTHIKRALISVSDKTNIIPFAKKLKEFGVELISTGGTAKLLMEQGVECRQVDDVTGFPEMMDGRLKTLHPKIHGGILAKRDNPEHLTQIEKQGIGLIDMIVVNLYPFEATIAKPDVTLNMAIENIDIGGPTMIRAAAKNYKDVAVVTDPQQYDMIINIMSENNGAITRDVLFHLAIEAFALTNRYDGLIAAHLSNVESKATFPDKLSVSFEKVQELRYGENPHQQAAFYTTAGKPRTGIAGATQLHGKELSYNNIMDLDGVLRMVLSFQEPACVIVKHSNPCGAAVGDNIHKAFTKAFATDSVSAYGGIFAFNRTVELPLAEELSKIFIEVIVAPEFSLEALELLRKKKNVRLLTLPFEQQNIRSGMVIKDVLGGILVQEQDGFGIDDCELKVVTNRQPAEKEWAGLKFGWKVVKWVKSNAIVFTTHDRTIGIGAGQMSRVDSVILAGDKAKRAGLSLEGTIMASDAFFPFRDGIDSAAAVGVTAIIQPGGSVRDEDVITAANEHNIAMVFTGMRHFRH